VRVVVATEKIVTVVPVTEIDPPKYGRLLVDIACLPFIALAVKTGVLYAVALLLNPDLSFQLLIFEPELNVKVVVSAPSNHKAHPEILGGDETGATGVWT
jgi:hypothetical protein